MADKPRYVGGQAVLEGVMMRGEQAWAVAVRTPDGDVKVEVRDAPGWGQRWGVVPLVRGVVSLAESLVLGVRALTWSANQTVGAEEQLGAGPVAASLAVAMVLFSAIFIVLPAVAARAAGSALANGVAFNLAEGVLRLTLFLGYLLGIGRLPDIRRLFQYHGAEHKAIAAYENGVEVTPDEAQKFSTEHVRCGTNFLLLVMVMTILLYSVFGRPSWAVLLITRVTLIPVVAGLSYEIIRVAARNIDKPFVRRLMTPGLALQRVTTREPSIDQLEVAIAALRAALTADQLAEVDARVSPPVRAGSLAPVLT